MTASAGHTGVASLTWFSLRARWRRSRASSLTLALLIGGLGGFVLAAAATARRVESAYHALLTEIDAPDFLVSPGCPDAADAVTGCSVAVGQPDPTDMVDQLGRIPAIDQARPFGFVRPYLLGADRTTELLASADNPRGCFDGDRSVALLALNDGAPRDQAVPFRLVDELPAAGSNGVVLTHATAERVGLSVGDRLVLAGWCDGDGDVVQLSAPIGLVLTGLSIGPFDIEPSGAGRTVEPAYVDPTVWDAVIAAGATPSPSAAVWVDRSQSPQVVAQQLAPFDVLFDLGEQTMLLDAALETDARFLWTLAGIGAVTAILLLAPIIARSLRSSADDMATLVALGCTRGQVARNTAAYVAAVAAAGVIVESLTAPAISAVLPRGLADDIVAHRQLWFDGMATSAGAGLLVVIVFTIAAVPIWRTSHWSSPAKSVTAPFGGRVIGKLRIDPAVHTGVLAAVGKPAGRRQASPWPSLVSLAIVGTVCIGSLTYLSGLRHLEQDSRLVGWNWDAVITIDAAASDPSATMAEIAAVDGVDRLTPGTLFPPMFLSVPGTDVTVWPWSFATGPDAVTPTMLSGRAPEGPDEVAIDPVFTDLSGLGIGDIVSIARPPLSEQVLDDAERLIFESGLVGMSVERSTSEPVVETFEITGVAVLPLERTGPIAQAAFTLGGLAALVKPDVGEIDAARASLPDDLPTNLRGDIEKTLLTLDIENDGAYAMISGDIRSVADRITLIDGVEQIIAPRSEEVVSQLVALNLSRNDRLPTAMTVAAAAAGMAFLVYLGASGTKARRSEMALLRALGFTSRSIRRSLVAQAATTAMMVLVLAVPIGLAVGRWAWLAYARGLDVLPESRFPWQAVGVLGAATAVVVAGVAVFCGWFAIRRSLAGDLRAE